MVTESLQPIKADQILSAVETHFQPLKEMGGTALVSEASLKANSEMRTRLDARVAHLKDAAVQAAQGKPTFFYYDNNAPGADPPGSGVTFSTELDGVTATINVPLMKVDSRGEAMRRRILTENQALLQRSGDERFYTESIQGGTSSEPLFSEFPGDMTITLDHGNGVTETVRILDKDIPVDPDHPSPMSGQHAKKIDYTVAYFDPDDRNRGVTTVVVSTLGRNGGYPIDSGEPLNLWISKSSIPASQSLGIEYAVYSDKTFARMEMQKGDPRGRVVVGMSTVEDVQSARVNEPWHELKPQEHSDGPMLASMKIKLGSGDIPLDPARLFQSVTNIIPLSA